MALYKLKKSTRSDKKYMAEFADGKVIHFGGEPYTSAHFKDNALGLYSAQNHNDKARKLNYYKRHFPNEGFTAGNLNAKRTAVLSKMSPKSAKYLSSNHLW